MKTKLVNSRRQEKSNSFTKVLQKSRAECFIRFYLNLWLPFYRMSHRYWANFWSISVTHTVLTISQKKSNLENYLVNLKQCNYSNANPERFLSNCGVNMCTKRKENVVKKLFTLSIFSNNHRKLLFQFL